MKKGFTLIELLAVIVILAILAVIATPIVLNIIDDSKNSSLLRSAENYLKALEQKIANENSGTLNKFEPSRCVIQSDGNALCDNKLLVVEINGQKPNAGAIIYASGKAINLEIIYDDIIVTKNDSEKFITREDDDKDLSNQIVYFDVSKGSKCTNYNESNSNTGYNGINNKTGNQNSCLKFYVLNDNETTLDLILDHNTTVSVAWNSTKTYSGGPKEVLSQLKTDTASWVGVKTPTNYVVNNSLASYTIDYSTYKARLITSEEIATITGNTGWTGNYYSFDSKTQASSETCTSGNTSGCKYGWLYDRTSTSCKATGCLNNSDVDMAGYWTASSALQLSIETTHVKCTGHVSYGVSSVGRLGYACVNSSMHYGVRPVITITK